MSNKPTSSRAIIGALMPTLLGLLLLLIIPVWSLWKMELLHRRIESEFIPVHDHIEDAINSTHKIRNAMYTYVFSLKQVKSDDYAKHKRDWQAAVTAITHDTLTGKAAADWQAGAGAMQQWLSQYADELMHNGSIDGELPGEELFVQGMTGMEAASADIKMQARKISGQIQEWERGTIGAMGGLGVICVLLGLISWRNVVALHRALGEASQNAERLEVAVRETNHRVKNNLQTIGALIDMNRQEHGEDIPRRVLDDIYQQVRTVAAVHDFLSHERHANRVAIQPMLQKLVKLAASGKELAFEVCADAQDLPVKEATSMALIANELVLNAGKHGASQIRVTFQTQEEQCRLRVNDDGPGLPPDFTVVTHGNLGTMLIETLAHHDLCGDVQWRTGGELFGAEVEITFPTPTSA